MNPETAGADLAAELERLVALLKSGQIGADEYKILCTHVIESAKKVDVELLAGQCERLARLREQGMLSEADFSILKDRMIGAKRPPMKLHPTSPGWLNALPFIIVLLIFFKIFEARSPAELSQTGLEWLQQVKQSLEDWAQDYIVSSPFVVERRVISSGSGLAVTLIYLTSRSSRPIKIERVVINDREGTAACDGAFDKVVHLGDSIHIYTENEFYKLLGSKPCGSAIMRIDVYTDRGEFSYGF